MTPLLDITRLMSRAGRTLTGIDRVERAYLDRFLHDGPVFGLARTGLGFLLIDGEGLTRFRERLRTGQWGTVDALSRWSRRLDPVQKAAVSSVRADARARCLPWALGTMVRRSGATDYFNVGHVNLDNRSLSAIGAAGLRRHVLVHDTIPLDHPEWQRRGAAARFRARLDAVRGGADVVICNSRATLAALRRRWTEDAPPMIVAPLGFSLPEPAAPNPLPDLAPGGYFLTVGTIEPRKNHALLLDLWTDADPPKLPLVICGPRGWADPKLLARLDRKPSGVIEMAGLNDAQLATVIRDARALLFPSLAEGFGLPPMEAAALGTPVVCGDLAIYRETLADIPVYLDPNDPYQWRKAVNELTEQAPEPRVFTPPTWEAHFKSVLTTA